MRSIWEHIVLLQWFQNFQAVYCLRPSTSRLVTPATTSSSQLHFFFNNISAAKIKWYACLCLTKHLFMQFPSWGKQRTKPLFDNGLFVYFWGVLRLQSATGLLGKINLRFISRTSSDWYTHTNPGDSSTLLQPLFLNTSAKVQHSVSVLLFYTTS